MKKRLHLYIYVAVIIFGFANLSLAQSKVYVVGVENIDYFPHYTYENGKFEGHGRAILDAFATRSKLPAATTSKLKIVLDELISNIINYGYADDAEHEIEICLELVGHRLVVTIADDGVPFNPLTVKPPDTSAPLSEREIGGLGIHLVRNLVDETWYRRRVDKNTIAFIMLNDVRTKKAVE